MHAGGAAARRRRPRARGLEVRGVGPFEVARGTERSRRQPPPGRPDHHRLPHPRPVTAYHNRQPPMHHIGRPTSERSSAFSSAGQRFLS